MGDEIEKLQRANLELGKQLLILAENVAGLRASVSVLKLLVATRESPNDPEAALEVLRQAEKLALKLDPETSERQQAHDLIDALRVLKAPGPRGTS